MFCQCLVRAEPYQLESAEHITQPSEASHAHGRVRLRTVQHCDTSVRAGW